MNNVAAQPVVLPPYLQKLKDDNKIGDFTPDGEALFRSVLSKLIFDIQGLNGSIELDNRDYYGERAIELKHNQKWIEIRTNDKAEVEKLRSTIASVKVLFAERTTALQGVIYKRTTERAIIKEAAAEKLGYIGLSSSPSTMENLLEEARKTLGISVDKSHFQPEETADKDAEKAPTLMSKFSDLAKQSTTYLKGLSIIEVALKGDAKEAATATLWPRKFYHHYKGYLDQLNTTKEKLKEEKPNEAEEIVIAKLSETLDSNEKQINTILDSLKSTFNISDEKIPLNKISDTCTTCLNLLDSISGLSQEVLCNGLLGADEQKEFRIKSSHKWYQLQAEVATNKAAVFARISAIDSLVKTYRFWKDRIPSTLDSIDRKFTRLEKEAAKMDSWKVVTAAPN